VGGGGAVMVKVTGALVMADGDPGTETTKVC